jgi:hypothetical protein
MLPGQVGTVLDRLFLHGYEWGGRCARAASPSCSMRSSRAPAHVHRASSLVHARDDI